MMMTAAIIASNIPAGNEEDMVRTGRTQLGIACENDPIFLEEFWTPPISPSKSDNSTRASFGRL
jgi:hypothetical protein